MDSRKLALNLLEVIKELIYNSRHNLKLKLSHWALIMEKLDEIEKILKSEKDEL